MAGLAPLGDAENITRPQLHLLRHMAAEVVEHPAHVVDVEASVQRKHIAVARAARDVAVRGGVPVRVRLPDLVAARAGFPPRIFIVNAGARKCDDGEAQRDERRPKIAELGFWLSQC